ncbi:MAG: hypothetical protein ACRCWD_03505 [Culicoidibacterales bacterium]
MYKILYRAMFIILTTVALFYLAFGFTAYMDAQNQLLSGSPPSKYVTEGKTISDVSRPEISPYFEYEYGYRLSPLAPTDNLDVLWETGLYIQIAQGTVTFLLALVTTIFGVFAITGKKIFAILAVITLPLAYLSDEIFSFFRLGIYGFDRYNVYIFNILEIIILLSLLAMCIFTIRQVYRQSIRKETPSGESELTLHESGEQL